MSRFPLRQYFRPARVLTATSAAALLLVATAPFAQAAPGAAAGAKKGVAPTASSATPATLPVGAAPALVQQPTPAGCRAGNLCFWVDAGFHDGPGQLSDQNDSWFKFTHSTCRYPHALDNSGGTWADCVSSIYNHGNNCSAIVWFHIDFGSPGLVIPRGWGTTDLRNESAGSDGNWNDNIESNSWTGCG